MMEVEGLRGKDSVGGKPRPEKDVSSIFSILGAIMSDWRWLWIMNEMKIELMKLLLQKYGDTHCLCVLYSVWCLSAARKN